MSSSLSVFARASTSVGKWDGGDIKVCDSTLADVGDLKEQIAIKMKRATSDFLSLHPVLSADLDAVAPPSSLASKLPKDALLTDPAVASHIISSGSVDTQRLYLIALLSPTEGAWRGCGVVVWGRRAWALTLPCSFFQARWLRMRLLTLVRVGAEVD